MYFPFKTAKHTKKQRMGERVGVYIALGGWRISVFEQGKLAQGVPLLKGVLEFFLHVARLISRALDFRFFFGTVELGFRLGHSQESLSTLRAAVLGWDQWKAQEIGESEVFAVPVPVHAERECRDWCLLVLKSADDKQTLGAARNIHATVYYRPGQKGVVALAKHAAVCLHALIQGLDNARSEDVSIRDERFPDGISSIDTSVATVGQVFRLLTGGVIQVSLIWKTQCTW